MKITFCGDDHIQVVITNALRNRQNITAVSAKPPYHPPVDGSPSRPSMPHATVSKWYDAGSWGASLMSGLGKKAGFTRRSFEGACHNSMRQHREVVQLDGNGSPQLFDLRQNQRRTLLGYKIREFDLGLCKPVKQHALTDSAPGQ